jgi:hypothetical protein
MTSLELQFQNLFGRAAIIGRPQTGTPGGNRPPTSQQGKASL